MDDRRTPKLELIKKEDLQVSSGVVTSGVGSPAEPGITTGTLLEGKYVVGRVLGTGAVGIVYEAKNVELDETVAIKVLRPEMMTEEAMVGRFAREAKAAAGVKSEYVATVYDVGITPTGTPYIVMEYLDGKNLGEVVEESGTIGPRTAVEYALQVCEALAVAHSRGVVHRDIKPENLLLTERAGGMKIVKVLDFGISKAALTGSIFKSAVPLVKTVSLMGTPLYMSPEQVRVTDSVDVRSDIWSLGMVMYEMLTGHTAFDGQSITEICAQILESQPRPIEVFRNDLPSGLVEVISKCLNKDVTKRYQNVAELAMALMPFGPKRTRLNVERAVAVLQAAGQLAAHIQVNSTMPPSSAEHLYTPIPRAPSLPSDTLSSGALPSTPSAPVSSDRMLPVATSFQPVPEKRRPLGLIVGGGLAVVAILAGIAVAALKTPPPPAPTVAQTATPTAATPSNTTAATQTATATASDEAPEAVAPGTASHAAAVPVPRALRSTTAAPHAPAPRTKKSADKPGDKPSDEPDLGY